MSLSELIKALSILRKYGNPDYPTHCEHDVLTVCGIDVDKVSKNDVKKLDELGFFINDDEYDEKCFQSFRYGSS